MLGPDAVPPVEERSEPPEPGERDEAREADALVDPSQDLHADKGLTIWRLRMDFRHEAPLAMATRFCRETWRRDVCERELLSAISPSKHLDFSETQRTFAVEEDLQPYRCFFGQYHDKLYAQINQAATSVDNTKRNVVA